MNRFSGILLASLFIIIFSCKDEETKPVDIGLDYFPLRKGFYQVYYVDETNYLEGEEPVNAKYELKVEVADSFATANTEYTYVLYLYTRSTVDSDWDFLTTWSARRSDQQAVIIEGNIPYVKLTFPVTPVEKWDGNALNGLPKDEYSYKQNGAPLTIAGITFNNTVIVEQEYNDDAIVYRDIRDEVYAPNAGLIYKSVVQLEYCTDENCIGQEIIKSGKEYKQELKEYGIQ